MRDKLLRLLKETATYGTGSAVKRVIGIFLLPILTRWLTPSDYGVLDLIAITLSVLPLVTSLGSEEGADRFYFDVNNDTEKRIIVSTTMFFRVALLGLVSVILLLNINTVALVVGVSGYEWALRVATLGTFMSAFLNFGSRIFRWNFKLWRYNAISMANSLGYAVFPLLFVVVLKRGVNGVVEAQLIVDAILAILMVFLIAPYIGLHFSRERLWAMMKYGLPLVPIPIIALVTARANRYFLLYYFDQNEIGLFSIANKLSLIVVFVCASFQRAWGPFAFSIINENDSRKVYARSLTYFILVTGLVATGISLFFKEALIMLTTPAFYAAGAAVPFLVFAEVAKGSYFVLQLGAHIEKQSKMVLFAEILAAVVNIALNWILVPRFGIAGAGIAALFSYVIACLVMYSIVQKIYNIPYELKRIGVIVGGCTGVVLIGCWSNRLLNTGYPLIIKAIIVSILLIILCMTKIIPIRAIWKHRINS